MKIFKISGSWIFLLLFLSACSGETPKDTSPASSTEKLAVTADAPDYDPQRGEGKFTSDLIKLGNSLDVSMAEQGAKIQSIKCGACHKLTDEKLVGPGWQGVTTRRKPEWIMNFITNPDPMIEKDPALRAQLELCMVRMPNQALSDIDARNILEFMRKNDGVK
jgi:Cytochrome c